MRTVETLKIESGRVELAVNGDPERIIAFDPEDVAFAAGFYGLAGRFAQKEEEYRARAAALQEGDAQGTIVLMEEMCGWLRKEIDGLFGEGTCETAFGSGNSLRMYQQFFEGVVPYVRKAREKKLAAYTDEDGGVLR